MDVIARWVRVITLAKGRHVLNLYWYCIDSESYKTGTKNRDKGTMLVQ